MYVTTAADAGGAEESLNKLEKISFWGRTRKDKCMAEESHSERFCTRRMERKLQNTERQQTTYDLLFSAHVMNTELRSDHAPCKRKGIANKYLSGTM